jgi:lipoprotein-anchoring transpeptidase ErfK/SrfK
MVDYYSALMRAVTAPDAGDVQWRRGMYDRARQLLATRLRERRPPARQAEITAELSALDAAIARIEAEMSWADQGGEIADVGAAKPEREPIAKPLQLRGSTWLVLAVVVAALGAGALVFWPHKAQTPAPPATKSETPSAAPKPASVAKVATSKDGDLAAGIDGGSSDPDQAYVFRRQSTFYRTLQPVGTVIIDKLQHFLYLIQPNNVAVRYGIGLGSQCTELAGLRHVASKTEWPPWQPPPGVIERNPAPMPGGPGNPLGARLLQLDDNSSRINGTNAPKTVGTTVIFGCFRLANDDVVDLYNRVPVGASVVVN